MCVPSRQIVSYNGYCRGDGALDREDRPSSAEMVGTLEDERIDGTCRCRRAQFMSLDGRVSMHVAGRAQRLSGSEAHMRLYSSTCTHASAHARIDMM